MRSSSPVQSFLPRCDPNNVPPVQELTEYFSTDMSAAAVSAVCARHQISFHIRGQPPASLGAFKVIDFNRSLVVRHSDEISAVKITCEYDIIQWNLHTVQISGHYIKPHCIKFCIV